MIDLQSSPHCSPISAGGRDFDIHIHWMQGEADWVLEFVDEHGTSFCFDHRFANDAHAFAEARRAVEAGECTPMDPAAAQVQAAFVRVGGCPGLAYSAAYALGYITAAISLPPQQHGARAFTAMLDPDAEMAELEVASQTLGRLYEALAAALAGEHVDLSHLSAQSLADWARGYLAYVEGEPRWTSRRGRGDELGPIVAFAAPALADVPKPMRDLTEAHDVLAEAATLALAMWTPERQADFDVEPRLEAEVDPFRRDAPKAGRNEPCPCGSGKKYKKCCLPT